MVLAGGSDSNGHDNNMIINKKIKGGRKGILVIEMLLFMIKYLSY
jgi:hypothetical protein